MMKFQLFQTKKKRTEFLERRFTLCALYNEIFILFKKLLNSTVVFLVQMRHQSISETHQIHYFLHLIPVCKKIKNSV